ncbi:type II toxin-antitoxin system VapC family toxin [Ilumatobacter sp.]|uniref:type II toxin-antitoxin system VapC family toxin n=1 Tax=Ilumatobacter sp. TaxID=1967498 RepID=UPI003C5C3ACE
MIVWDTNVVSELMRPEPDELVVAWADRQSASEVFITAITLAELWYGIGRLPMGRRRNELAEVFDEMLTEDFERRVLDFDRVAAAHHADLVVERERIGRPISLADAQIAAICRSHGAAIATRNVDDFADVGVDIMNPWTDS